jgi:hypothetical protein
MSGGGGETAQAPDLSWAQGTWKNQYNIANQNMEEAKAWAKEHGTTLDEALKQIQPDTFKTARDTMGTGADLMQKYKDMYGPLQEAQAKYAANYASPERIAQAQAQAGAGVSNAFKAAGDAANRNFERYGGDPSVGRGGALDLGVKLAEATAKAGAMDNARRATETTGQQLIQQAIGTGQNVANTGLQATQTGVQAGATGIGEGTSTFNAQAPALGNSLGWFGGANQAISGSVNTDMSKFQAESKNADTRNAAAQSENAAWGKLAGTALSTAMMFAADGGPIPEGGAEGGEDPSQDPSLDPMASPGSAVPLSASPSRGAVEDDVPARVQPGEFIFPKDVMAWRGEQWAQKEVIKARKEMGNGSEKPAEPEAKPALNLPPTYMSPGAMHGQAVPLGGA